MIALMPVESWLHVPKILHACLDANMRRTGLVQQAMLQIQQFLHHGLPRLMAFATPAPTDCPV